MTPSPKKKVKNTKTMKTPKDKISISTVTYLDLKRDKNGSVIVADETWYENEGMSDLGGEKALKFWVFVRRFVITVGKSGKVSLFATHDVEEVSGKTHKAMVEALEELTDGYEGIVPEGVDRNWIPDTVLEIKKALKSGALKV